MTIHTPLEENRAWGAVGRCVVASLAMLVRRQVRLTRAHLGLELRFADGTRGRVYRETVAADCVLVEPCLLVVCFRLRGVRGWMHRAFEWESLLNTPLFVGFPGFVSKLWLAHDEHGTYRGVYQWDGPEAAEEYAEALWRVLALVSEPASIDYRVVPGLLRDDVLTDAAPMSAYEPLETDAWWRVVGVG